MFRFLLPAAEREAQKPHGSTSPLRLVSARLLVTCAELEALPEDLPIGLPLAREEAGGPLIEIDSPRDLGTARGPFRIRVRFQTGPKGHPADMTTLKLVYPRAWGVDITDRVRAYVAGAAIEVDRSEPPHGRHTAEIQISATQGNTSRQRFTVTIE